MGRVTERGREREGSQLAPSAVDMGQRTDGGVPSLSAREPGQLDGRLQTDGSSTTLRRGEKHERHLTMDERHLSSDKEVFVYMNTSFTSVFTSQHFRPLAGTKNHPNPQPNKRASHPSSSNPFSPAPMTFRPGPVTRVRAVSSAEQAPRVRAAADGCDRICSSCETRPAPSSSSSSGGVQSRGVKPLQRAPPHSFRVDSSGIEERM